MLLSTLYWPDEVRDLGELDLPAEQFEFKPAERQMATQLVQAMTGEFDPAQYHDEYREALTAVIQAKIEGQPVEAAKPEPEPGKLTDLMAVLEASVAAARQASGDRPGATGGGSHPDRGRRAAGSAPAARRRGTGAAGGEVAEPAPAHAPHGARSRARSKPADAEPETVSASSATRTERRRRTA